MCGNVSGKQIKIVLFKFYIIKKISMDKVTFFTLKLNWLIDKKNHKNLFINTNTRMHSTGMCKFTD